MAAVLELSFLTIPPCKQLCLASYPRRHLLSSDDRTTLSLCQNASTVPLNTLRNYIKGAGDLGRTAILIAVATTGYLFNLQLRYEADLDRSIVAKLTCLIVIFLFSFFNYMQTTRFANNLAFILHVDKLDETLGGAKVLPNLAVEYMNRCNFHSMLGQRAYYLAVPSGLWLFGAIWLFIGSIATCCVLLYLDSNESRHKDRQYFFSNMSFSSCEVPDAAPAHDEEMGNLETEALTQRNKSVINGFAV